MKNINGKEEHYNAEYAKPVMGRLNCKIEWGIISDAASVANNHIITSEDCSNLSRILNKEKAALDTTYRATDVLNDQIYPTKRLATMEKNLWQLDGTYALPVKKVIETEDGSEPEIINKGQIGWVSKSISDDNGNFKAGEEPKLEIVFDNKNLSVNLVGLMINFFAYRNEYPLNYDIEIIRKDELGAEQKYYVLGISATKYSESIMFSSDTITDVIGNPIIGSYGSGIINVAKIVITIKKWNVPGHRARVDEIEFGTNKYYDNATLVSVDQTRAINAVSSELPISTFAFTVLDNEMLFDSENPNSLTQYLTRRQPIKITWNQLTDSGDVEIPGGEYYLKEWNDSDSRREYKLVAEDLIGFTEEPYYKGIFTGQPQSVKVLIKTLFDELFPASSGLSEKLDISDVSDDITISAPLPLKLNDKQCTYKDCLMMLAQIAGCIIVTDDEGRIVFRKLKHNYYDGYTGTSILPDNYKVPVSMVFDNPPQSNLKSPLREVKVNYYGYSFDSKMNTELHKWKFIPDVNNEITFELNKPGKIFSIRNGITDVTECFSRIDYTYMTTLKYIGDLSIACGQMPDDGYELTIAGKELLAPCGIYSTGLIDDNISGEVVTIDCPLCSNYSQAEALAQNFIVETLQRDEFEIEVKRNMLWECGDVLELEKPIWGSDGTAKVPCRLIEDKKSLTSVRQKLKLRKISLDETV